MPSRVSIESREDIESPALKKNSFECLDLLNGSFLNEAQVRWSTFKMMSYVASWLPWAYSERKLLTDFQTNRFDASKQQHGKKDKKGEQFQYAVIFFVSSAYPFQSSESLSFYDFSLQLSSAPERIEYEICCCTWNQNDGKTRASLHGFSSISWLKMWKERFATDYAGNQRMML